MKEIPLTNSLLVALVDDEDYEKITTYGKWRLEDGYAKIRLRGGKWVPMQNLVSSIIKGVEENDHIDRNRLNNQRNNLRKGTRSQNKANSGKHKDNTLGYKGIKANGSKWQARITVNYKDIYLGTFPTKELAAIAYNIAAKQHFGEFAFLNVII